MTSSDPGRRQILQSTLGITAAAALGTAGLLNAPRALAADGGGRRQFPPVPGMHGDRRANELWYQFDEITLVSQPPELKDAYAAIYSYIDQVGKGSIADIWLEMVKTNAYPGNFTAFAAPIKQPLEVVSRIQLGVFDAFYHPRSPRLVSAFSWFGQGVLYDPRRKQAHTMNGDPPRGYHTWHAYLRAMMFHDIDRQRWRELAPRIALAWATQSTAKPDVTKVNPPLPRETVRRLKASWIPRTPERLDTDLQSFPYPWSTRQGGGR
ncbi:hypothetical protein [Actinomadura rudentiformis]|uniref:Tat pathway signal sequence domain protein n=1 Tax=Actinomadura rudentiformis TaxID=359158 RepID=A0A6H9YZZ1_9ACTN|nr:hypothetical protein [Actinomadura rudentiformis]KAB2352440.1 hypothetical protein F8566_01785 [Actinomadura rudentiformis]